MTFVHPERLWLLAAWGVLVLWSIRGRWLRRRGWAALAQRGRPPREGAVWWLGAIACLILALAQPKWGRMGAAPAPGHDLILLVDVSRSMGAEDAVPNRLAMAVEYAEKLVDAHSPVLANRAGVVAFAGRGVLRCPLTENLAAVIAALKRLHPGCVQPGGTDLGAGLDAALEALGTDEHAEGQSIVVLSDGEDLAEHWKPRLDRLEQREVLVYAITIGDAERGQAVPSGPGDDRPLLYRGQPVQSRRVDTALETIARQTGGTIVRLGLASADASVLYRNQIAPSARRRARVPRIAEMAERFPLFLVAALSCLMAACWPPRRGWSPLWTWRPGWGWSWIWTWIPRAGRRRAAGIARAGLIVAAAGLVLGAGQSAGPTPGPPDTAGPDRPPRTGEAAPTRATATGSLPSPREAIAQGRSAYDKGRLEEALAAFEAAARAAPASAVPHYDAAAALFGLGRYDEARQRYTDAAARADEALRTKIDYALGNTALALGDVPTAIAAYDACIASTARGADLDVVRRYAAENRAFASQQAQAPSIPQGQGPDDASSSRRPDGRRSPGGPPDGQDPSANGDDETGPSAGGADGQDEAEKERRNRARRRRRTGGAGGSRTTPPGASGESPEDRLDAALDNIRAAQSSRRLPDEPPPASSGSDGRDW